MKTCLAIALLVLAVPSLTSAALMSALVSTLLALILSSDPVLRRIGGRKLAILRPPSRIAVLVVVLTAPTATAVSWLALDVLYEIRPTPGLSVGQLEALPALVLHGISSPILEEVVFRVVLICFFMRFFGQRTSIALSAIIFGVFHLGSGYAAAALAAVLGVSLGVLCVRMGIGVAALTHSLINLTTMSIALDNGAGIISQTLELTTHEAVNIHLGVCVAIGLAALLMVTNHITARHDFTKDF